MRIAVIGLRGVPNVIGGIETHCENLYPELARLSGSPEVFLLTRKRYQPENVPFDPAINIVRLRAPASPSLETAVYTFLAILYARFVISADLVSLHGIGPGFFTPLARLLGMKTIVTHHSPDYFRPKWGIFARMFLRMGEFLSYTCSNGMICVSDTIKTSVERKFGGSKQHLTVIRNGVPRWPTEEDCAEEFLSSLGLSRDKYVLAVGRLDATKAFHELITAFERMSSAKPDMKLVIIGNGPDRDVYVNELLAHGGDRIRFVGFREGWELRSLYRNAALFAHPSHMEGYGIVVAEALHANKPVILSDIPAHREFLLPNECYFKPGDVMAIEQKLRNPDFSAYNVPSEVRARVLHSWPSIAKQHLHFMVTSGIMASGVAEKGIS